MKQSWSQIAGQVASRWWKKAGPNLRLDLLARLQVLEGAAKVRPGSWTSKRLESGMQEAQEHFVGSKVNEEWFSVGDTKGYDLLKNQAKLLLSGNVVGDMDADDFLQIALSGVGATSNQSELMTYAAGETLSAGIKDGRETIRSVFGGKISKWISKRIGELHVSEALHREHEQGLGWHGTPTGADGEDISSDVGVLQPPDPEDKSFTYHILSALADKHDALSRKIQDKARAFWSHTSTCDIMIAWLDLFVQKGGSYHGIWDEAAEAVGKNPKGQSRAKDKCMSDFVNHLKTDRSIMRDLEAREFAATEFSQWSRMATKRAFRTRQGSAIPSGIQVFVRLPQGIQTRIAQVFVPSMQKTIRMPVATLWQLV